MGKFVIDLDHHNVYFLQRVTKLVTLYFPLFGVDLYRCVESLAAVSGCFGYQPLIGNVED